MADSSPITNNNKTPHQTPHYVNSFHPPPYHPLPQQQNQQIKPMAIHPRSNCNANPQQQKSMAMPTTPKRCERSSFIKNKENTVMASNFPLSHSPINYPGQQIQSYMQKSPINSTGFPNISYNPNLQKIPRQVHSFILPSQSQISRTPVRMEEQRSPQNLRKTSNNEEYLQKFQIENQKNFGIQMKIQQLPSNLQGFSLNSFIQHSCVNCSKEAHYKAATSCKYYCTECAIEQMVKGVQLIQKPKPKKSFPSASKKPEKNDQSSSTHHPESQQKTPQESFFPQTHSAVLPVSPQHSQNSRKNLEMQIQNGNSSSICHLSSSEECTIKLPRKVQLEGFLEKLKSQQKFLEADLEASQGTQKFLTNSIEKSKEALKQHYRKIQQALECSLKSDIEYLESQQQQKQSSLSEKRQQIEKNSLKLKGIQSDIQPNLEKIVSKVQEPKYQQFMFRYRAQVEKIANWRMESQRNSEVLNLDCESSAHYDQEYHQSASFRVFGRDSLMHRKGDCSGKYQEDSTVILQPSSGIFFSFEKKRKEQMKF